jgi:hypothetical protein
LDLTSNRRQKIDLGTRQQQNYPVSVKAGIGPSDLTIAGLLLASRAI